jgi:hypothetical protein
MPPSLSPELQALADPPANGGALQSVALRLEPQALARIDAVRDRLNRPTLAAVMRAVVSAGLDVVEAQLAEASR